MAHSRRYPKEWLEQVPAVIFGCLLPGELRLVLHPGAGFANGGVPRDVPVSLVPPGLRLPNTLIWVQFDDNLNVVRIWGREVPTML